MAATTLTLTLARLLDSSMHGEHALVRYAYGLCTRDQRSERQRIDQLSRTDKSCRSHVGDGSHADVLRNGAHLAKHSALDSCCDDHKTAALDHVTVHN